MENLLETKNLHEFLNLEFKSVSCDKPSAMKNYNSDDESTYTGITVTSTVFI